MKDARQEAIEALWAIIRPGQTYNGRNLTDAQIEMQNRVVRAVDTMISATKANGLPTKIDSKASKLVKIDYTNWQGERDVRVIEPIEWFMGSNTYHPNEQWLCRAFDLNKKAERIFAVKDIHSWTPVDKQ